MAKRRLKSKRPRAVRTGVSGLQAAMWTLVAAAACGGVVVPLYSGISAGRGVQIPLALPLVAVGLVVIALINIIAWWRTRRELNKRDQRLHRP